MAGVPSNEKAAQGPNGSAPLQTADDMRDANAYDYHGTRIPGIGTGRESELIRVPF